jgi:orotate phosphoribosyltransferase
VGALNTLFRTLHHNGFFQIEKGKLVQAGLNPNDCSAIRAHISELTRFLYEKLFASGIQYDAIASIPTGGDEYVRSLIEYTQVNQDRVIHRLQFSKSIKYVDGIENSEAIATNSRILVVDDAIFTGMTARSAGRVLCDGGYRIAGYLCVADLEPTRHRILKGKLMSLFNTKQVHVYLKDPPPN